MTNRKNTKLHRVAAVCNVNFGVCALLLKGTGSVTGNINAHASHFLYKCFMASV